MKEHCVVKGLNFCIEKNLARAYRDGKCISDCVSETKNGITFDIQHEFN